jgi:peptidoglycan/xylan/chitin deacetylase (PgdA/CDA1 family)
MKNALTVDLEDYFHVSAYAGKVRLEEWDSYPSRVAANTDRLLGLLAEHNCLATFFVLGWVAEKKPEVVARVAAAGHEIACHSLLHRRIFDLTPQEFREDTHRAKAVIEDATGKQVVGYRAPSFSVIKKSLWALEILAEEGFQYDFPGGTSLVWDSGRTANAVLDRDGERTNPGISHADAVHWIDEIAGRRWSLLTAPALQLHALVDPAPE